MWRLRSVLVVTMLALWCASTGADIVYLKNKTAIRGEVVAQDETSITLRVYYGEVRIERDQIDHIEKEDALARLLTEADALAMKGDEAGAQRVYAETVRRFPDCVPAARKLAGILTRQARLLLATGKAIEAEPVLRTALELDPTDEYATRELDRITGVRRDAATLETEAALLARIGRGKEALAIFDRLTAVLPEVETRDARLMALAHVAYADHLAPAGDYAEAGKHYDRAVQLDAQLQEPLRQRRVLTRLQPIVEEINRGVNDMSRQRRQELAGELRNLEEMAPTDMHVAFTLGVVYQQLGQTGEAVQRFGRVAGQENGPPPGESVQGLFERAQKAVRAKPLVVDFDISPWTQVEPEMKVIETEYFEVHAYNQELGRLTAEAAEYFRTRICAELSGKVPETPWPKKCGIYIYADQKEYQDKSKRESWSPASAQTTARGGELKEHRIQSYQTVKDLLGSHLPHELTHIIQAAMLNFSTQTPAWLREGTAVHFEPWHKRDYLAEVLRKGRDTEQFFALEDLVKLKEYPEESRVNLFYVQSLTLTETLMELKDMQAFHLFCQVSLVRPFAESVNGIYGLSLDEVNTLWKQRMDQFTTVKTR